MGFVKLLLDTRGLGFYSKLVLGPHKQIMLMWKANQFLEQQTPAFDVGIANVYLYQICSPVCNSM